MRINGMNTIFRAGGANQGRGLLYLLKMMMQMVGRLLGGGNQNSYQLPRNPGFGGTRTPNASTPRQNVGNFLGRAAKNGNLPSIGKGTALGRQIAGIAARTTDKPHYCFRAVARTLSKFGVNLSGRSAYMAADQLARNPRFREVKVPRNQLRSLPAGAVVVWNRGRGLPHGHIGIALGNGQEASWKTRQQLMLNTSYRVFMPVK